MPVYMIQAGGEWGPVKIGHGDPVSRLLGCQVGNHLQLRLIRTFEGDVGEEAALHVRFADLWIRGEWHNFSRAMLGDVGMVDIPLEVVPDPAAVISLDQSMDLIRTQRGLISKIARGLAINSSAVSMWDRVPAERLPDVERITQIPRHRLRPDICPPPPNEQAAE